MGCEIETKTGPLQIVDHQSCIACRTAGDHKCNIKPYLTPGVNYPKCTLLVKPEDGCEPLTALADLEAEKERIIAVTSCDIDLTEVTAEDNCPQKVLTWVGLDPNYLCWPEGATQEQIDVLVRNLKGCIWFVNRMHCTPLPKKFQHLLEDEDVVKAKAEAKPVTRVPVQTEPATDANQPGA